MISDFTIEVESSNFEIEVSDFEIEIGLRNFINSGFCVKSKCIVVSGGVVAAIVADGGRIGTGPAIRFGRKVKLGRTAQYLCQFIIVKVVLVFQNILRRK